MGNDAFEQSHSGSGQVLPDFVASLAREIRDLQDILGHLVDCQDRNMALAVSNRERIDAEHERITKALEAERILRRAAAGGPPVPGPRHAAAPGREHPHLRLVRGSAAAALLGAGWRWVWRAHRMVTLATAAAVTAGAAATAPVLMASGPPAAAQGAVTVTHHHARRRDRDPWPLAVAPPLAHSAVTHRAHLLRDNDHGRGDGSAGGQPTPSPSASPSPSPSPSVTISPSPGPTNSPYAGGG